MTKLKAITKLKTFFHSFKNSAFKPAYYKDILKAPFTFSFKYFLFLFLSLTLLSILTLSIILVQKASPYINEFKTKAPSLYPTELEITIKEGQAKTNVTEPFFIPLDPDFFPQEIKEGLNTQPLQNILVIDTKANPSNIKDYQTFALLTKNDIAFIGDRNEIRIQTLEEIKDFTLNKKIVNENWGKITPYFKYIIPTLIIALFIFLPTLTIITKLIYLLFISLLTWASTRLIRPRPKNIDYKKALQINLHAITLPTIIIALFQFLGTNPRVPFFSTIILIIFNLIIFTSLKEK